MISNLRNRYIAFAVISLLFLLSAAYYLRDNPIASIIQEHLPSKPNAPPPSPPDESEPKPVIYPHYKPEQVLKAPPIVDNFPLAAAARSAADLPPIPSWNTSPKKHLKDATPLLIGFTRNWLLLQQVVVSYITAGWPASDIYVIENTGVMDSNEKGNLSLQNPFFLNYTRLHMFGVNIIRTPTLLSFAQLQNFFTHTALEKKWLMYFWSHMDVVAVSFESHFKDTHPDLISSTSDHSAFESIYHKAVKQMLEAKEIPPSENRWALRFFNYDRLALVNVEAFMEVGGWDTMIPYYMSDCDMHSRLAMAGLQIKDVEAGLLYDVASSLEDLIVLYRKSNTPKASFVDPNILIDKQIEEEESRNKPKGWLHLSERDEMANATEKPYWERVKKWEEEDIHSENWQHLVRTLEEMQVSKYKSKKGRNTWQGRQIGGQGEPFYRDPVGFENAIQMTIDHGRKVFAEKWGHRDCDIREKGLVASDAWRVEHDWKD